MDSKSPLPENPPSESAVNAATANLIARIGEAIQEFAADIANDWAESENMESDNIFMTDRAQEILAANLALFINKAHPRPHQFTDTHAEAYLGLSAKLLPRPQPVEPKI